jgi:hypothetical protein
MFVDDIRTGKTTIEIVAWIITASQTESEHLNGAIQPAFFLIDKNLMKIYNSKEIKSQKSLNRDLKRYMIRGFSLHRKEEKQWYLPFIFIYRFASKFVITVTLINL